MEMTRTLYAASRRLLDGGMVPYVYYKWWDLLLPMEDFYASSDEVQHYEVSQPKNGLGSWWVPVGTTHPEVWENCGGVTPLKVEQDSAIPTITAGGALLLRPKHLLYWIPSVLWGLSGLEPGHARGRVKGAYPTTSPSPITGKKPRVRFTPQDSEEFPIELHGTRFSIELPRGFTVEREGSVYTVRMVNKP